jgi:hypothetical protein
MDEPLDPGSPGVIAQAIEPTHRIVAQLRHQRAGIGQRGAIGVARSALAHLHQPVLYVIKIDEARCRIAIGGEIAVVVIAEHIRADAGVLVEAVDRVAQRRIDMPIPAVGIIALRLAVNLHKHLIKVPAPLPEPSHPVDALAFDVRCEHRAEAVPPEPSRLMANVCSSFK